VTHEVGSERTGTQVCGWLSVDFVASEVMTEGINAVSMAVQYRTNSRARL